MAPVRVGDIITRSVEIVEVLERDRMITNQVCQPRWRDSARVGGFSKCASGERMRNCLVAGF